MSYENAKIQILNHIMQFCLSRSYDGEKSHGGFGDSWFYSRMDDKPQKGDLVALQAAPASEWCLSWYKDIIPGKNEFLHKHVLESVLTGKICNWHNVSFMVLNRKELSRYPSWKWTDAQFKFQSKWYRACRKNRHYGYVPMPPVFIKNQVTVSIRKKWSQEIYADCQYPNWKKVLSRDMTEFYVDSTRD